MKILLTFTGFHDPFAEVSASRESETGPVLTVTTVRNFNRFYLFATPSTADISARTKLELPKRPRGLRVTICEASIKNPSLA